MEIGRGEFAGGHRQVRVGDRTHHDHEGLPGHRRRGPKLIMCAGMVTFAVLGFTSGIFAVAGF